MKKRNKYGLNGLLLGAAGGAIYSVVKQMPALVTGKPFDWQAFGRNTAGGALIGGGSGNVLGSVKDYYNARERRINTDRALNKKAAELVLTKSDPRYCFLRTKADQLSVFLQREYHGELVSAPTFYGSTEKGIALAKDFDIDLGVPFHASRFSTGGMYDDLQDAVETFAARHGGARVRLQDKSIGILFPYGNSHLKLDVVPLRVSDERVSKMVGYLFVNSGGLFSNPSRTKTDLNASLSLPLDDAQKKLMVLLKEWKRENDLPFSTYLLQTVMNDAYMRNRGRVPASLTSKLMMVVKHMESSIDKYHFYGRENTNNCLTDFSSSERSAIASACRRVITDVEYQPNDILKHF
jgi:hypothetical protein